MDGDQEDRNPLDKGKGKERAQSLPETADEASTTPPTVRANSSPEGNQSVLSNHPSTSAGPRLSRSPASQVREELEGGRRRSLAPGNESGPNEGTLRPPPPPRSPPQRLSALCTLRLSNNFSARLTQSCIGPVLAGSSCAIPLIPSELELLPPSFPRPAAPINIPMPYSTIEGDAPTYRGVTVTGGGTAPTADTPVRGGTASTADTPVGGGTTPTADIPRRVSFNIPNEHPRGHRSHSDVTNDSAFIRDHYHRTFSQAPPLVQLPPLPERAENITPRTESFEARRQMAQRAEGSSILPNRAGSSSDLEEGTSTLEDQGDDEDASRPSGSRSQNTYHQHFRGRPSRRRCSFTQQDIEESQEDNLPFGTLPRSFEFEHEYQRVLRLHSRKLLDCQHNERVTAERYVAMMNCVERQHRIRMLFDSGRLRRHSLADFRATIERGTVTEVGDEEASTEHVENVETYPNQNVQIETQEVESDDDESDDEVGRLMKSDSNESDDDESDGDENVQDEDENGMSRLTRMNAQDEDSRASRVFNEEDRPHRPQLYRPPTVARGRKKGFFES